MRSFVCNSRCSGCGELKTIAKMFRKLKFCASCPTPKSTEYETFMYKHTSVAALIKFNDKRDISNGISRKTQKRRNEKVV